MQCSTIYPVDSDNSDTSAVTCSSVPTPPQLYLFILRTLLSIALKQSWCSTVPRVLQIGNCFDTLSSLPAPTATVATLRYDESPAQCYQAVISTGQSAECHAANVLMHDDDGMGPTFDPFNFSHERREITPAF